ncbi:flavodoxin domain-containing protein [Nocardioides ferulae]|uniref:flavodoxin domain-containing protein n=1 Tax=Nocardioides ferulae TaxID=2340821 RepID=UPI000EACEE5A|nr:flavodoxin domain-containing protein [Nocardioides ferulae]
MTVLVAYASRYGATRQIAGRIGAVLSVNLEPIGQDVRVRRVQEVDDLTPYDSVVVGAATYRDAWLPDAVAFVERHHQALVDRPVWLFASGPLGAADADPSQQWGEAPELARVAETLGALDFRRFAGALQVSQLSVPDRVRWLRAGGRDRLPQGDFRDWNAIDAWAHRVADDLGVIGCR